MTKDKDKGKGCTLILIIGLIIGIFTGLIAGINISTWNYAEIIVDGYAEIIRTEDGGMYINQAGMLYSLEPVVTDTKD